MIKKIKKGKYILYNKTGTKVLGRFSSRKATAKRLRQIEFFKRR